MRKHCHGLASYGGDASYSLLKGCVEMESRAAADKPMFKP